MILIITRLNNKMEITAQQIAAYIDGQVEGDEHALVNKFAKIEEGVDGALSFLSNSLYEHYIYETKSSVVLVNNDFPLKNLLKQPLSVLLIHMKQ